MKRYWFRRETEPDPTTPKYTLRYTGRAELFRSPTEVDGVTELITIVDSVEVAMKMVELANEG